MKSEWLKPYYSSLLSAEPITTFDLWATENRAIAITAEEKKTVSVKSFYTPSRILKSGNRTIVFWPDGTKTIVKRAEDETESDYAAFTAALGIKDLRQQQRPKTHRRAHRDAEAEKERRKCN